MEGRKLFPRSKPLCRLSDPANTHNLCRRSDPPLSVCSACKGQHLEGSRYYYYCSTCDLEFHRGCHFYPPKIRHPFHLLHPLTLTFLDPDYQSSEIPIGWFDASSESDENPNDIDTYVRTLKSVSDGNHAKCISCRTNLQNEAEDAYYHCSTCNFSIHSRCCVIQPPLTIENLKSHDHTLTLFPRQVPLPCDACGLSLDAPFDHTYSCLLCNYMVHRRCIYLPRVIKITRHPHRLSHTSSLVPSGELLCGVCRKTVDIDHGSYSCNKGCHYAVHSKCATKDEVWDGIDLEGVPEEEEEEDIEPFVRIDEETILHFSHDHHHLKIHWNGSHENKFCQACTLLTTVSDRFYSCISCEFVLHETCASLPRKKHHPVHKHPLTLFHLFSSNPHQLETEYYRKGLFRCKGCDQWSCGFMYQCSEKDCHFQLDARCASLPDPFIHDCHPHDHPLFFNLTHGKCMGCKSTRSYIHTTTRDNSRKSSRVSRKSTRHYTHKYLECIKCNSFLCLQCATLPSVAHYKHDKHPLTLCCGEEETTDVQYWCEICEGKLDATEWFYTCNSCRITLHVTCLLGKETYMKPNHSINMYGAHVDITRNSGPSRPVCDKCRRRCIYALVFKWVDDTFCSVSCLLESVMEKGTISCI